MSQSKEQIYMAGTPVLFSKWGKKKKKNSDKPKARSKISKEKLSIRPCLNFQIFLINGTWISEF